MAVEGFSGSERRENMNRHYQLRRLSRGEGQRVMVVEGKKREPGRGPPGTETLRVVLGTNKADSQGASEARNTFGLEYSGRNMFVL